MCPKIQQIMPFKLNVMKGQTLLPSLHWICLMPRLVYPIMILYIVYYFFIFFLKLFGGGGMGPLGPYKRYG